MEAVLADPRFRDALERDVDANTLRIGLSSSSTFGSYLRERLWTDAANSMLRYDTAGGQVLAGLAQRREIERALFLSPVKPVPNPLDVLTHHERALVTLYTSESHHPHLHRTELKNLRAQIALARKAVYRDAVDGVSPAGKYVEAGWGVEHRIQRYHILEALVPPAKA